MTQLKHPNIITLFEIFDAPKRLYIIMELATGGARAECGHLPLCVWCFCPVRLVWCFLWLGVGGQHSPLLVSSLPRRPSNHPHDSRCDLPVQATSSIGSSREALTPRRTPPASCESSAGPSPTSIAKGSYTATSSRRTSSARHPRTTHRLRSRILASRRSTRSWRAMPTRPRESASRRHQRAAAFGCGRRILSRRPSSFEGESTPRPQPRQRAHRP